jgi:hypothetical protein
MEPVTYAQWKMFYRQVDHGTPAPQQGINVRVVTPIDQPLQPQHTPLLPTAVELVRLCGLPVKYLLRRMPRLLDWGPRSSYSNLFLFKVRWIYYL